jgi:uroporphyrinogen-III synthase
LPFILEKNGHQVNEIVSYQTLSTPDDLHNKYKGILFFSPSGIESYLKKNKPKEEVAFCIGETTAAEAHGVFKKVIVARSPSVEAVVRTVNEYFENIPG